MDFDKGCFPKVSYFQELILGLLDEVSDKINVFRFQAVIGSHGEVECRERHIQLGIHFCIGTTCYCSINCMDLLPHFRVLDKGIEVLAKDLGCFDKRHFRMGGTIGPDFQCELVIIRFFCPTRVSSMW